MDLLLTLPGKPRRSAAEAAAAELIGTTGRAGASAFSRAHAERIYRRSPRPHIIRPRRRAGLRRRDAGAGLDADPRAGRGGERAGAGRQIGVRDRSGHLPRMCWRIRRRRASLPRDAAAAARGARAAAALPRDRHGPARRRDGRAAWHRRRMSFSAIRASSTPRTRRRSTAPRSRPTSLCSIPQRRSR